jgi:hypothetical protein
VHLIYLVRGGHFYGFALSIYPLKETASGNGIQEISPLYQNFRLSAFSENHYVFMSANVFKSGFNKVLGFFHGVSDG